MLSYKGIRSYINMYAVLVDRIRPFLIHTQVYDGASADNGFCINFCTSAATTSDVLRTVMRQSYENTPYARYES